MYVQGKREAEKGEKETTTQMEQNKTQQQKTKQSTALMFHDGLLLASVRRCTEQKERRLQLLAL